MNGNIFDQKCLKINIYDYYPEINKFTNLIKNWNFADGLTNWTASEATLAALENECSILALAQYGGPTQKIATTSAEASQYVGHKIYFAATVKVDSTSIYLLCNDGIAQTIVYPTIVGSYQRISGIRTIASGATQIFFKLQDARSSVWTNSYLRDVVAIDLTLKYGQGNEPTTAAEMDEILQKCFRKIKEYDECIYCSFTKKFGSTGSFELEVYAKEENLEVLKKGNFVEINDLNCFVIESVNAKIDATYGYVLYARGRTISALLDRRIIWGTFSSTSTPGCLMNDIVEANCVSPNNFNRAFPNFYTNRDDDLNGDVYSYQQTGKSVLDALIEIYAATGVGFDVEFDVSNQKMTFCPVFSENRTINQNDNVKIIFSSDSEDLLSSDYFTSIQDFKNVALVAGEDSGELRKATSAGSSGSIGLDRYELYVDARDLQSTLTDSNGNSWTLTDDEYIRTLVSRGNNKLLDYSEVQTFDAEIRQFGSIRYKLNEDYFLGDIVTVVDKNLGLTVDAQITEVVESWKETYSIEYTFGFSRLTIMQKVKRLTN